MRTVVYIDGFNLYYRALKGTPYRWLNLERMCRLMLPAHDVQRINYYTAPIVLRPDDPQQPVRQQVYLRALETLSTVRIHLGQFLSHPIWMRLADPSPGGPKYARVVKTEEKGSDVNLATHLLRDAYENAFEAAVLVTNDSDLKAPVELVRNRLAKRIGLLNPERHPAFGLKGVASFFKTIRPGVLRASQFPEVLVDKYGSFRKPAGW